MPSEDVVRYADGSLAPGEDLKDLLRMTDLLIDMRKGAHPDPAQNESVVARIICILVIVKPEEYVSAMQEFRMRFKGIDTRPELQDMFTKSVHAAALEVARSEDVVFQPSVYFSPPGPPLVRWF